MNNKHWQCIGPITLSALSLLLSFFILQPLALFLDPTFNLLASRGIGKVAFVSMAIYQILLLLAVLPSEFLQRFFKRNLFFFKEKRWFSRFSLFFTLFFFLHACLLLIFYLTGYVSYNPSWGIFNAKLVAKTLFGLFVVFMLAWTEELIFRGTIYPYLKQYYKTLSSLFLTSLIFMLVHNLRNPLTLLTTEWKLGLGLFLLGVLLNQIFVITKKLYTGMGAHAGLVFVKVILRRAPFLYFIPAHQMWLFSKDLRQSHLVHLLFAIVIISLFTKYRKKFVN